MRLSRRTAAALTFASLMVGCAGTPRPVLLPDPPVADLPDVPPPIAPPPALMPMEVADLAYVTPQDIAPPVSPKAARAAIAQATARHTVRPSRRDFHGVEVRYPYVPGKLWAIEVTPHEPVHLSFDLIDGWLEWSGLDVGESGWWEVKTQKTGAPPQEHGHLLVSAKAPGKSGKMTVLTGRGAYYLSFHSLEDGGMTAVSWKHPAPPPVTTASHGHGIFYTGYQRSSLGHAPPWAPLSIWDSGPEDGRTFLLFPKMRESVESPLLYVLARDGAPHLVNYRVKGQWYIVDQLFEKAELRVGQGEHAEVVLIERGPSYRGIRCPGDEACPPGGWQ
jgi:type IV secretory pathway VirB9-like protein